MKNIEEPQWSKDFPINVGQDNYVVRRDFTKYMVLTSFAFAVGQFWIGIKDIFRRTSGIAEARPIADITKIPIGSAVPFNYPEQDDTCLLIRRSETEFVAFSQKCTHLSCAVVPKFAEGRLNCPCHEGCFDMLTGRPLAGPPRRPLPKITLVVRGNTIFATGVEVSMA